MIKLNAPPVAFVLSLTSFAVQAPLAAAVVPQRDESALLYAAANGELNYVTTLLDIGVNPNCHDEYGGTALMYAAGGGHAYVVEALLDLGADPNAVDNDGDTPLGYYASRVGLARIAELLLDRGADVNAANDDGVTALHFAALKGHHEFAELLLDNGADLSVRDDGGWTALLYAAMAADDAMMTLLLERGADIDEADEDGTTLLMLAARDDAVAAVAPLLDRGATLFGRDEDGNGPLSYAAYYDNTDVLTTLLELGAEVDERCRNGATPLMVAAVRGSAESARVLLDWGADVNATADDGVTALMIASESGHIDAVRLLLDRGADVDLSNATGATAMRLASRNDRPDVVELLETAGAQPVVAVASVLPLLDDLPEGAVIESEGPIATNALDAYQREFRAEELVFKVGSSEVAWLTAAAELHNEIDQARTRVMVLNGMSQGVVSVLFARGVAQKAGFDPDTIETERIDLEPVGDEASSWKIRFQAAGISFDFYTVFFVRDRVAAQLMVGGGSGRIRPDDVARLALLIDRNIQNLGTGTSPGTQPFAEEVLAEPRESESSSLYETVARSEGFDLEAAVLRLQDLDGGARVTTDGYSHTPAGMSSYEREFEASNLLFEVGSSRLIWVGTAAELYTSSAAAIRAIAVFERVHVHSVLGEDMPEEGVDTVIIERADLPQIGDASGAWHVTAETALANFELYLIAFVQGRLVGALVAGAPSGQIHYDDVFPLAQLMQSRLESQAPSTLDNSLAKLLLEAYIRGESLLREGDIDGAVGVYAEAQELDSSLTNSAPYWNDMCWFGSLWGSVADVMPACDQAVALNPDNGAYRGSRGLARALSGDFEGAVADFEASLDWDWDDEDREQHEDWLEALRARENPFTIEVLESLRKP